MSGPLAGVRVLDLTRVLAGPTCTMTLADLGAEVWKIEHPEGGDETRSWRPPDVGGEATYFLAVNRGKRSVAIDLKRERGLALVHALAERADVVVASFLPDALVRFGLDAQTLRARLPRLIYATLTGYGTHGPYAANAGYDFVIQAESGLMAITGDVGGAPMKVGVAITDVIAGMNLTQAILAALYERTNTGRGRAIDIALLESAVAALANVGGSVLNTGRGGERYGNAHASIVPYQTFDTADGVIVIGAGNNRQFRDLCGPVLGVPELADDPRYATNTDRVRNREELCALLAEMIGRRTTADMLAALHAATVPAGEIRSVAAALAAPELAERGTVIDIAHPAGPLRLVGSPLGLGTSTLPPPLLGEHTRDVLAGVLGLGVAELDALEREGAIRHRRMEGP